jgi:predicted ribosome quality control (RQC) complex YloA/Tae2 family protein
LITYAAQLAAYYSKAKSSTLVPVVYTLKKFVRKPKGAIAGTVTYDNGETILVEPVL